jgi:hypothetical protein
MGRRVAAEGYGGLRMIGCAVKEGEGCNVAVDGKGFGEEIGGVDEAGKEDKTEELLTGPILHLG